MLSDSQRLERARDAVSGELDRIVQLAPSPEAQTEPARRMLAAWKVRILGERSVFLRKLAALRKKLQRPS